MLIYEYTGTDYFKVHNGIAHVINNDVIYVMFCILPSLFGKTTEVDGIRSTRARDFLVIPSQT